MKTAVLVHGWGGTPEGGWFPWLNQELTKKGWKVVAPQLPDTFIPKIESWTLKLNQVISNPNKDTYFIGHSIGCQTIMRYLEKLDSNIKVGGVIFVAGFFDLTGATWDEQYTEEIAKPWLKTPINFNKIKQHTNNFISLFSDNDPYVSLSDAEIFKQKLGAKTIIEHNQGHFAGDDGITELPIVLDELMRMAK